MDCSPDPTVPDALLERFRLGELAERETLELRRRIEADPALQARLLALRASDEEILLRHPASRIAGLIRARLESETLGKPIGQLRAVWLVPATAVLALAVVSLVPLLGPTRTEQLKGSGPALILHRKTAAGSEVLVPGAIVRAGDLLRIGYRAGGRRFGVIVSVDGRGVVTQHLPATGEEARELGADGAVLLDSSFELDDAPSFERFFLVTSDAPFAVATVKVAASRTAGPPEPVEQVVLRLPPDLAHVVFELRREPR